MNAEIILRPPLIMSTFFKALRLHGQWFLEADSTFWKLASTLQTMGRVKYLALVGFREPRKIATPGYCLVFMP